MSGFLSEAEWLERYKVGVAPLQGAYLGFYSSLVEGFFEHPWGFFVPVDDHIVHRGDGIFEAVRAVGGAYFDLEGHLARLGRSAEKVALELPYPLEKIRELCLELGRLTGADEAVLRIYVSRGPGGFTPNPYEPKRSQLYLVLQAWSPPPPRYYQDGVRAGISRVLGKRPFEATIKSCNYLQNVMQKKDAIDRGLDFTVCLNENGEVLEGATESFCILNGNKELLIPSTQITLAGTTIKKMATLAADLKQSGWIAGVREAAFKEDDVLAAREMAFVGTTIGVCPVTTFENKSVGDGRVGSVMRELGVRLEKMVRSDKESRSAF